MKLNEKAGDFIDLFACGCRRPSSAKFFTALLRSERFTSRLYFFKCRVDLLHQVFLRDVNHLV